MTHPAYVKEKALQLRREKHLSIVEIAERLALPKTTIYYWLKDEPLGRPRSENPWTGARRVSQQARIKREEAYQEGVALFSDLARDPTFRDFVCMYIGEGTKRNRNVVALCNSNPSVIVLGHRWITALSRGSIRHSLQYHADQDVQELHRFWEGLLKLPAGSIRFQRKSNSQQLKGRQWRSRYGVLTVSASDTHLRAQLQAWIDLVTAEWQATPAPLSVRPPAA